MQQWKWTYEQQADHDHFSSSYKYYEDDYGYLASSVTEIF